jgi:isopentenyl diphosphate isomerase/L-lactate dehydrogenase-like FMN-dependent dehydrogenase
MDIKTSKIGLVKMILNIENATFIQRVIDFINNEKADFWNELSAEEQAEIKRGIEQLNQGKRKSYKEVLDKIS